MVLAFILMSGLIPKVALKLDTYLQHKLDVADLLAKVEPSTHEMRGSLAILNNYYGIIAILLVAIATLILFMTILRLVIDMLYLSNIKMWNTLLKDKKSPFAFLFPKVIREYLAGHQTSDGKQIVIMRNKFEVGYDILSSICREKSLKVEERSRIGNLYGKHRNLDIDLLTLIAKLEIIADKYNKEGKSALENVDVYNLVNTYCVK